MLITLIVLYTAFVTGTLFLIYKIRGYACYYESMKTKFTMRAAIPICIILFDILLGIFLLLICNYFLG